MQVSTGTRLGPYEIVSRIGAGGMGEVWKARDTRLERSVAVKILPAEFAQNAQLKVRFEREAKTISQLEHAHICRLYDVGETCGGGAPVSYLVMELLEGESLADRLARGALPLPDVLKWGAQIAEALDKAHRAGVTHRDLKPGNVMITKGGAKLLDFGLAKSGKQSVIEAEEATQHKPLTQEGTILGTFQYMAPEQLAGEDADARTDIFALGAVLYEMATGKRAFEGKTKTSLVSKIVAGEPRPLRDLQPLTPPALEHVITKCLSKERDDRWQSASDIAEELRWIAEQRLESGPAAQRARPLSPVVMASIALVTIAAAMFAVLWWQSRARPRPRFTASILPPPGHAFNFESGAMALSPDGARLAFVASDAEGKSNVFIHDFETGVARRLEGTANSLHPFWSPDGRYIGFFGDGKLKTIDINSGPPQALADAPEARGGSWSSSGTIVYSPRFREGLVRIDASGGKPQQVTKLAKGEISHRWAHFLPDGEHLLFLVQRSEGGAPDDPSTVELLSLSTGKRRELLRANSSVLYATAGYLLFWRESSLLAQPFDAKRLTLAGTPVALAANVSYSGTEQAIASVSAEGTLVYHAGGKLGQSRVAWSSREGTNTPALPLGDYWAPALSPDGKRLAVSLIDRTEDLRIFDLERGIGARLTFHSADEDSPVWSPDGQWVAFRSNGSDPGDVYRKRASGEGPDEPLVVTPHGTRPTGWSPDGKSLLIEASGGQDAHSTTTDIWLYSFEQKKTVPLLQTPFSEGEAVFSPDGKSIAYASDESGRMEVYVRSLSGGDKWQVSTEGGRMPRWRSDGEELFYLAPGDAVTAVKTTLGATFAAGKPEPLFTFRQKSALGVYRARLPSFDAAGDGQRFVVNMVTANTDAPITLVQQWTAKLAERR